MSQVKMASFPRPRPEREIDTYDTTEAVAGVLREVFGTTRGARKRVAKIANTNIGTAKNWIEGRNGPGLAHFFRMARQVPELKALACQLMAMEADLDPRFERALHEFTAAAAKFLRPEGR